MGLLMAKNRELLVSIALVVVALLIGAGIGRSFTRAPASNAKAVSAPDTSVVTKTKPAEQKASLTEENSEESSKTAAAINKSLAQILKNPNAAQRTKELEDFVRHLAPSDIGEALKQLRKMPDGSARKLASGLLVSHWIETDPEGALKFAAQNHDFDYITSDVFQQFAAGDVQAALQRAQSIADPNARYQALRGVLSYMADSDPSGALQLANTLGSFANNEPLSQMIYRQWASIDPQAAASAAAQSSADGGWRSPVNQVLRNWAGQDPLSALAWVDSQVDPSMQARDIGQIIRQWSRDDESAAVSYVNNLGAGPTRDAAAAALAFSLGGSDPSTAISWAQSIGDPTMRDNAIQRLVGQIMATNPANGAAILQAAGIPQNMIPAPNPNGGGRGGRRGP
jgi:hypothetical protein